MTRKKGRPVSGPPHNAKAEMWLLGRLGKRQGAAPAAKLPADRTEAEQHHRPGRRFRHPVVGDRDRAGKRTGVAVIAVEDERVLAGSKELLFKVPELTDTARTSALACQSIIRAAIGKIGAGEVHSPRAGIERDRVKTGK